jgi:hypothetical protein
MIDKLKYNPPKRLFKEFFESVSTPNALKYAEREKKIYRKAKGKEKARR